MTAFTVVTVYLGLTCIISLINKNRQSSTKEYFRGEERYACLYAYPAALR